MRVVNLFGGPGSGKSTTAAGLFAQMKLWGHRAELVTEFAKDKVWESSLGVLENQIYVFGKQHQRLFRLWRQVDYVVTDSPLLISLHYAAQSSTAFKQLVLEQHARTDSTNVFLTRVKPYQQYGRYQTADEARLIDVKIREDVLERYEIPHIVVPGDEKAVPTILEHMKIKEISFAF